MRPETDEERLEREIVEANCDHDYETIEMPYDWERMSGVMSCKKCSYGIPVDIERVKDND